MKQRNSVRLKARQGPHCNRASRSLNAPARDRKKPRLRRVFKSRASCPRWSRNVACLRACSANWKYVRLKERQGPPLCNHSSRSFTPCMPKRSRLCARERRRVSVTRDRRKPRLRRVFKSRASCLRWSRNAASLHACSANWSLSQHRCDAPKRALPWHRAKIKPQLSNRGA